MDEYLLNTKENNIIQNEITLMRFIISQCNEETLVNGGQVGKTGTMTFDYQLPSGLHVYSDRKFDFENVYKKNININEPGSNIYITGKPVKELEDDKKSGRYNSSATGIMHYQDTPFISYRENPIIDFSYRIDNRHFDENDGIQSTRSSLVISSDLNLDSEYPISGGLLLSGRKGYDLKQEEIREYIKGSEYFSDVFQRAIEENSEYNQVETLMISQRIQPLFEMLSIEKQRLQQIDNYKTQNEHENDNRMNQIRTAIAGIKDLKLTQEEITYLENVLQELRESNNKSNYNNTNSININGIEEK